jgi:sugar-specific transcriptional regulator TrmB
VIPPHEIFEKSRNQMKEQLDDAENELNFIYENQIPKVPAPMWLIHGPEKIVKKEIEIISRAKKSLFILGGFMFKDEVSKLKESLNKAIKRGVHVKVILAPFFSVDNDKIDILEEICELKCEMKTINVPLIKMVVRDEKEMLMGVCKIKNNKIMPQTAIGMWNQYNELSETISGLYNFIWTTELFNKSSGE